jgi:hypothetical protein
VAQRKSLTSTTALVGLITRKKTALTFTVTLSRVILRWNLHGLDARDANAFDCACHSASALAWSVPV